MRCPTREGGLAILGDAYELEALGDDGAITGLDSAGITVASTGIGVTTLSGNNAETGTTTLTSGILRAAGNAGALGA